MTTPAVTAMTAREALGVALRHAAAGIPTFPVAVSYDGAKGKTNKRPLTPNGFRDATTDPEALAAMFAAPSLRPGEVLGVGGVPGAAGFFVLDIDGPENVAAWDNRGINSYEVETASGGLHVWFLKRTKGARLGQSPTHRHAFAEVDVVRSDDGFVMMSGTQTPWGAWAEVAPTPARTCPAELWDALDVRSAATSTSAPGALARGLEAAVERLRSDGRAQDADALDALCTHHGGHSPFITRDGRVQVTRPGKSAGAGATVGVVAPGVVYVFTSDWPGLTQNTWYVVGPEGRLVPERDEPSSVGDPSRFFDKSGLLVQTLATEVLGTVALARLRKESAADAEDTLHTYLDGVWRRGGGRQIMAAVSDLLGERFRKSHAENVRTVIEVGADLPMLSDKPPHPVLLNFRNGMLDWRTGELLPHEPAYLSTVQLGVEWDPAATAPHYVKWLAEVLPHDTQAHAHELMGYLMLAGNPLHRAYMLRGPGRNGKGTWLRLAAAVLGERNLSSVSLKKLAEDRFAVASIYMKLANICGDISNERIEDTSLFKSITGDDEVTAELKYGHAWSFTPWAVPVFSANITPGSADTSEGYLSRWEVVPFGESFRGREDRTIEERLHAELAGIAVLAVEGLRRLMDRGDFARPASVVAASEAFADDIDRVRAWARAWTTSDPEARTPRTQLYESFKAWCIENGHGDNMAAATFYARLAAAGHQPASVRGTRVFRSIRIKTAAEMAVVAEAEALIVAAAVAHPEPTQEDAAGCSMPDDNGLPW